MKKIIVTGGSGFIGSNLVQYLIKKKYYLINIDKLTYSSNNFKKNEIPKNRYKLFKFDINNKKKFKSILNRYKPECIFNLAAETHVDRSIDTPYQFIYSNILGVFNILESIKDYNKQNKKIKLIHISTDEVYGDVKTKKSNEKFPYNPSSPYSASKASADHLIKSYIRTYNLPAIISNCCNNYGPFQFPEKLIPKIISNILLNKPLPIYAKGQNSREWIHVNDHCEALYKIFKKGKIGESYNVGSSINLKNINLVKLILNIFKKKGFKIGKSVKIKFVKDRPGHDLRYSLDSKKILKDTKWKSKTTLVKGLSSTIDWYLKNRKFITSISKKLYTKRLGLKI
ncbi:dTDP-glucose 4,6-dehydratase [Pelagibacteraceae bacterium]|nr:dTDP-glucose 4,6-dehydratase [Pelagibacteraceae bacterium]